MQIEQQNQEWKSILIKNRRQKAENIVAIFMALYSSFNKTITSKESYDFIVNNWMKGIEGLYDEQIKLAIDKCRNGEAYLPTIARFRFLAFGLIDTPIAFELAKKEDYKHPIIYYARKKIHDWKYLDETALYSRFVRVYGALCDEVQQGIQFCMPQTDSDRLIKANVSNLTTEQYKNWIIDQYGQEAWDKHFHPNFER